MKCAYTQDKLSGTNLIYLCSKKSKGGECFGYCDWTKYPKCDPNYTSAPKDVGNILELGSCALTLKLAKHVTSLVFNCHLTSLVSLK